MPTARIMPELAYPDVRLAVEWLCRAFGFSERLRIGTHRAQLSLGDGSIIVTNYYFAEADTEGYGAPLAPSSALTHSVMVRVDDIDNHFERAAAFGARIITQPTSYPYGERQYTADDLAGHRWTFSQTIADVDPESWGGLLLA